MSLKDRITEDMKAAMRAKDAPRLLDDPRPARRDQAARGRRAHRRSTTPPSSRSSTSSSSSARIRSPSSAPARARTWSTRKRPSSACSRATCRRACRPTRSPPRSRRSSREIGAVRPADMGKVMAAAKARLRRPRRHGARLGRRQGRAATLRSCHDRDRPTPQRRRLRRPPARTRGDGRGRRRGLSQRHQQPARFRGRPDQPTDASIAAAARAAGLAYAFQPVHSSVQTPEDIARFKACSRRCPSRCSRSAAAARARASSIAARPAAERSGAVHATRGSRPRRAGPSANTQSPPRRRTPRIRRRFPRAALQARPSSAPTGGAVAPLLTLSRLIDRISEFVGRWVAWLVLAAVLISAANAIVRKVFDASSNACLEIQWYLFAAVFLLAAGYTLHAPGARPDRRDLSAASPSAPRSGSTSSASACSSCRSSTSSSTCRWPLVAPRLPHRARCRTTPAA